MTKHIPSTRAKRVTAAFAALGAVTLGLTACGPAVGGGTDAAAAATDWSAVEPAQSISFWTNHPGGSQAVEKQIVDAFTAETGIQVEIVTAGANYEEVSQKFQTAQTSGDAGDLVVLSDATWFTNYVNDSLLPVDEVFEANGADTSTYNTTLFDDYLYEGSHYGVPYARSTTIYYYNKDQYAEAGIADAPTTWDEVKANSEKLIDSGVTDIAFSFPSAEDYPAWMMNNLVWGYGGGWSDEWDPSLVTSDGTVEAVQFAQDAVKDGWANVSSGSPADDFAAGATSQFIGSTGSLGGVTETATFDVGVAFLPGGPAEQELVVPTGGAGVSISAQSTPEEQKAAAMLADYLTNAQNTVDFSAATGYMPVRSDADASALYAENPNFEVAVQQLETRTRTQDFMRVFLPGGDLALATSLQEILTTDVDVKTALTDLETELQGLYDTNLKSALEG
ncbi:ABC transporter substrate-binding protein [Gulosibacter molinativorax]|uniref:ABC transporter substrate-binding protein n=1 Tax=Gulosibacter molinativorax TaxID=256821 RepID=A0ABT7CC02_9MICO|nr:ABC transporter substrate-binding protein [Gulosibacter molinativorax]MDJ1372731.1 ABC transporter substrate-binding protein [Gulosibacter molinativorax]QUY62844.1 Secreted sn-glycerol-3-phosphate-binding protein [Gulosibacter molinativorax]